MSKFKQILTGIKSTTSDAGVRIPHLDKIQPENATLADVKEVLSELRNIQNLYQNPDPALNLQNTEVTVTILGRAIDDILTLPDCDFS